MGIGFAIPVNAVKKVVPQLVEKGYVTRPWLGITGQDISPELARVLKLPSEGILIAEVVKGSPADKTGIQGGRRVVRIGNLQVVVGGDMIVAVDGKAIRTMDELVENVESREIGQSVEMTVLRDGKKNTVKVYLSEMPPER